MGASLHSARRFRPSLCLVLLCTFSAVLWIAGGGSRADVPGQAIVRGTAAALLVLLALFGRRPTRSGGAAVAWLLAAAIALALLQLVPLPPALWQALPGRAAFAQAALLSGEPQPWRSWSIVPGATANAAASLIVPATTLLLVTGLDERERAWLPGLLLGLIAAAMLIGLLQFSGAGFNDLLVDRPSEDVSGTFANRNHYALFLAFGCLLAPSWTFLDGRRPGWRGPVALGLVLLFVLTILASGSRAGLLVGALGLGIGLLLASPAIARSMRRRPRWVFPVTAAAIVGLVALAVLLSVAAGRAVSIERAIAIDPGQDMRRLGLPTVLATIRTYFPAGSGLGGFVPVFRMAEPFDLLRPAWLNHAHNDWLELVLDAGLPGLLLLAASVAWWAWASVRAWRAGAGMDHALPKLGSAMLLLVMIASLFDYPARTPLMMAVVVIAALWLADGAEGRRRPGPAAHRPAHKRRK